MLHWMRSRRELLAELVEAREQCATLASLRDAAVQDCGHAWEQRDRMRNQVTKLSNQRVAAVKQRDDAWSELAAMQGGLVKDNIRDYRPLSLRTELRREKARADQLAALVDRLQTANMAMDQPPQMRP